MKLIADTIKTQTRKIDLSRDMESNRVMLVTGNHSGDVIWPVDMTFQEAQRVHQALGSLLGPVEVGGPKDDG